MVSIEQFISIKKSEGYKQLDDAFGCVVLSMKVKNWVYSFHVNRETKNVEYRVDRGVDTQAMNVYNLNHVLVKNGLFFSIKE